MNNKLTVLVIFVSSLFLFLAGLETLEFTRINGRFALFIGEMNLYGCGIFPTLYNKPYTDYPSTHTFLMYLFSGCGNFINMVTATLPSALAGAVVLVFTYLIGARVSRKLGIYAVFFCTLSYEFVSICRAPAMDLLVAAIMIIVFYLIYTADSDCAYKRLWWLPLALILGFAVRGPLGLIIPTAVICGYYLINRQWLKFIVSGFVSGLLLFGCMAIWFGLCYQQGGKELLDLFLNDQIVSRFEKVKPPWYFLTNAVGSYAITYPLGLLVIALYVKKIFKAPEKTDCKELILLRGLAAWVLIVIIGLSIPGTKHLRYIVGIIPALALTASWILVDFDKLYLFQRIRPLILLTLRIFPWAALIALVVAEIVVLIGKFDIGLPFATPFFVLLLICLSGRILYKKTADSEQKEFTILMLAALTSASIFVLIVPRIEQKMESSEAFVVATEQLRGDGKICFFNVGTDGDDLKYLVNLPLSKRFIGKYIYVDFNQPQPVPAQNATAKSIPEESAAKKSASERLVRYLAKSVMEILPPNNRNFQPINPRFNVSIGLNNFLAMPGNTVFITKKSTFDKVPENIKAKFVVINTGKMGHQKYLAFRKD